ncbi:hypothetical protein QQ045_016402 [Rhodiola kirilowii]
MRFTVNDTYRMLINRKDEVNWHSLTWNRFNTPRASINAVLAAHDRLLTKSRLRVMGMMIAPICVLCNEEEENRDHLFFRCRVARGICGEVLKFLKVTAAPCHWHLLITWFNSRDQNLLQTRMIDAGVTYSMYLIWKERNSIIFRHESLIPINVCRSIIWSLKVKLAGLDSNCMSVADKSWVASLGS